MKQDVELLNLLPADSEVRAELARYVDDQIRGSIEREHSMRRDVFGIVLAVIFLLGAGLFAWWAVVDSRWWGLAAGILLCIGLVGLAQDVPRARRDDRGRRLPVTQTDSRPPETT